VKNNKKIRCPMCGHTVNNRIEYGSHIRRCKAIKGDKFKFNPKKNSKKKKK